MAHGRTPGLISHQPSGETTRYPRRRLWLEEKHPLEGLESITGPGTSCKWTYMNHGQKRLSETVNIPGERIERRHLQRWRHMSVRQRDGRLDTRAVLELLTGLEIDEVHSSCSQTGIAFSVLLGCGDDVGCKEVLRRYVQ